MSSQIVKRGFVPTDQKEFSEESMITLKNAQRDLQWLMERNYPIKSASTFVGNHYLLSERQRLAVVRATATAEILKLRKEKCLTSGFENQRVSIDGLNAIITLEIALAESTLIDCMDGTIRDLAGLRGTYRLIDKTTTAIELIGDKLAQMQVREAVFYLDEPVSNTGRLKQKIQELLEDYPFVVTVELVNNADVILEKEDYVITSDAIILNKCGSWINMVREIVVENMKNARLIHLNTNFLVNQ